MPGGPAGAQLRVQFDAKHAISDGWGNAQGDTQQLRIDNIPATSPTPTSSAFRQRACVECFPRAP
eukprot:12885703-Prorocentrum_lima.AAC.1